MLLSLIRATLAKRLVSSLKIIKYLTKSVLALARILPFEVVQQIKRELRKAVCGPRHIYAYTIATKGWSVLFAYHPIRNPIRYEHRTSAGLSNYALTLAVDEDV